MIDFVLFDCANNEQHKTNNFETLDSILGVYSSNQNDPQDNKYIQESEVLPDEACNDENYGSDSNSSSEAVFDEMSTQSLATSAITEDNTSKESQR